MSGVPDRVDIRRVTPRGPGVTPGRAGVGRMEVVGVAPRAAGIMVGGRSQARHLVVHVVAPMYKDIHSVSKVICSLISTSDYQYKEYLYLSLCAPKKFIT